MNAAPCKKVSNKNFKMFTDYENDDNRRQQLLLDRKIQSAKMKAAKYKIKIERIL